MKWLDLRAARRNLVGLAAYDIIYIGFVVAIFVVYYFVRSATTSGGTRTTVRLAEVSQIYWRLAGLKLGGRPLPEEAAGKPAESGVRPAAWTSWTSHGPAE